MGVLKGERVRHPDRKLRPDANLATKASTFVSAHLRAHIFLRSPVCSFHMASAASRRLALNLRHSLRAKQAIKAIQPLPNITRSFATPVSHGAKTECTTLSNGFTV